MPTKAPIRLKRETTELLASGNFGNRALILDDKDVRLLLRAAIEQEGSISAFARRHGLERSQLNNTLNRKRPVSSPLAKALGLRKVYTPNV
jgi:DNA-binding phage protein